MATPWIPQGVMCLKPVRDSGVMLMAKPCIEIHFLTPTPMEASFFSCPDSCESLFDAGIDSEISARQHQRVLDSVNVSVQVFA